MKNDNSTPARQGFYFYRSYLDAVRALPKDYQQPLMEAIFDYALDFKEPDFSNYPNAFIYEAVWANIKLSIKRGINGYLNGLGGGAPEGNNNALKDGKQPKNNRKTTKKQPTHNVKEMVGNDKENDKENDEGNDKENGNENENVFSVVADAPTTPTKKRISFVPPSLEEVKAYALEIGAPEKEAVSFFDYFTSVDWVMSGGRKIKDWKSAFRHWMNNADKFKKSSPSTPSTKDRIEIPKAKSGEFKNTLM